jgi:hypothetical protein
MKKISLFKKIKLFREYKKIIKSKSSEIEQQFGARIDNAKRIYNVINVPVENIGEAYTLKKSDIDKISENYIKDYSNAISKYFNGIGLSELYDLYEVKKVEKYSYLVVIGFSLFKSHEYYNNIRWKLIPTSILVSLLISLFFLI